ncbi:hypothetical protein Agub_g14896, partial [Astrephomene gubernaculifera]
KSHSSHLRLASGDCEGGVAVWSVLGGSVASRLEEHFSVREYVRSGNSSTSSGGGGGGPRGMYGNDVSGGSAGGGPGYLAPGGVAGLAWVLSSPSVLAVLLTPGSLLLWDTKGGAVLWKRELAGPDIWHSLEVDPLDCRRLAVGSGQGGLALLSLDDPASDRVEIKQYRIGTAAAVATTNSNSNGGATAAAAATAGGLVGLRFCATRDLLFLMMPREIVVFDTELGAPAASRPLPPGRPPFSCLLGVYGRGVSAGGGDEGGCEGVWAAHVDGSL